MWWKSILRNPDEIIPFSASKFPKGKMLFCFLIITKLISAV
jgi:hypothetical protein